MSKRKIKTFLVTLKVFGIIFAALCVLYPLYYYFGENGIKIAIIISIFLVPGIFILKRILNSPTMKGKRGEKEIARIIEKLADKYNAKVINDVIIGVDSKSSQIDHIVIHKSGIYVIETKNYEGRIYGNETNKYWTQVLAYGNSKNKLYNPVMQNDVHIKRLKLLLDFYKHFHTLVVFVKGNIEYVESNNVYTPKTLKKYIVFNMQNEYLAKEEIDRIYTKINEYKLNPTKTLKEHIDSIHK